MVNPKCTTSERKTAFHCYNKYIIHIFFVNNDVILVVLLHSGRSHAINDGIASRIHGTDGIADGQQSKSEGNHKP